MFPSALTQNILRRPSYIKVAHSTVSLDDCWGNTLRTAVCERNKKNMTTQTPKSSLLTSIFDSFSSLSPPASTIQQPARTPIHELILPSQPPSTTSPLHSLSTEDTERARSLFLTLHVLFPHELLPALDLLDRGLITRLTSLPASQGDGADNSNSDTKTPARESHLPSPNPGPTAIRPHTTTSKREHEVEVEVFYVQSASSTTTTGKTTTGKYSSRRAAAPASAAFYEVRLDSWNCSCPAFSVSAFQGLGFDDTATATAIASFESEIPEQPPFKSDQSDRKGPGAHEPWRFGGIATNPSSAARSVPSCKHILAAVLAKVAPGLFADRVIERAVGREELVGWGAGWGEFGGG